MFIKRPPYQSLELSIIHQDSNEELEESCVNKMISIKAGDKVYQYFQQDFDSAIKHFEEVHVNPMLGDTLITLAGAVDKSINTAFVVITKFDKQYFIEWDAIEKRHLMMKEINNPESA